MTRTEQQAIADQMIGAAQQLEKTARQLKEQATSAEAAPVERPDNRDTCSHCGERHSSHIGCRSDWTGVDKHGR
jgi:hypothetical protein